MSKKYKYSKSLVLTNGKRKNIRSNSKQDFQKKVVDAQKEIDVGIDICDQTTVVELIQTWFDVQKIPFIRETSQETLRQTIKRLSSSNGKISAELNETRWALLRANEKIEKLQSIEVSYETVPEEVTV